MNVFSYVLFTFMLYRCQTPDAVIAYEIIKGVMWGGSDTNYINCSLKH